MLKYLHLSNVGPAPEMEMHLAPRLNLITGDNGLGKSFLLDVAWWALTRRWPRDVNPRMTTGYRALPRDRTKPASITFEVDGKTRAAKYTSPYSARDEAWVGKAGRPLNPGLVLYAHSDGGFSVWDPARNYWKTEKNVDVQERLPAFVFSPAEVWDGLEVERDGAKRVVCNGLIRDWAAWIAEGGERAEAMKNALVLLTNALDGAAPITPGPLVRLSLDDVRDMPSIKTGYAEAVPVVHASAGVRRAIALAYMLVWSTTEHIKAAAQLGEPPTGRVVLLVDEIESHLHPRWQRSILGTLLNVAEALHQLADIQLIAVTHSPLVLASAEPSFNVKTDAWFDLDLEKDANGAPEVKLTEREFVRHGDVSNWLTSNAFDLGSARSLEAERAMRQAKELLASREPPTAEKLELVDTLLRNAGLRDIEPFWARWDAFVAQRKEAT